MGSERKFLGVFIRYLVGKLSIKYRCARNKIPIYVDVALQLTAVLVKYNIICLENASSGCEHKCLGALGAHFIGNRYEAMLITFLFSSHLK